MAIKKSKTETLEEKREKEDMQKFIDNRKIRFKELLGEDCEYIDALVINTLISPWDVQYLLEKGCPCELVPKILL